VYTHAVELDAPDALAEAVAATAAALGQPPRRAAILHDQIDGEAGGPLHLGGRSERGLARRALTANLERVYRALRALLPAMVAAGDGRIVAIDARLAERPWEGAGAALYGAAKAAALALARTAACEGRDLGVRVNAIAMGALDEPDTRAVLPNLDPARWVSPRAVAAVAAFLLSDDAAGITGATIPMFGRGDNAP
jgi:NAD(P)-dependent dehydrogenase (short-subunit alcohol dehydrogenase family)